MEIAKQLAMQTYYANMQQPLLLCYSNILWMATDRIWRFLLFGFLLVSHSLKRPITINFRANTIVIWNHQSFGNQPRQHLMAILTDWLAVWLALLTPWDHILSNFHCVCFVFVGWFSFFLLIWSNYEMSGVSNECNINLMCCGNFQNSSRRLTLRPRSINNRASLCGIHTFHICANYI